MTRIERIEAFLKEGEGDKNYNKRLRLIERLILGDHLTLNYNKKKAYINYYVRENTEEFDFQEAMYVVWLELDDVEFLEHESGNLETGEDHYYSCIRATEEEINSIKGITKYRL